MSHDHDDPRKQISRGVGLFLRSVRGAAQGIKSEMDRNGFTKSLDDAGREVARAATNVIGRIGSELQKAAQRGSQPPPPPHENTDGERSDDAPAKKPKGPTPSDPGFRIAADDDPSKDRDPR